MEGRKLTFHLVGINNQNFVMQDAETGTWWQQVSGEAILGPLKGRRLELVPSDQLTFGMWTGEAPNGRVLRPDDRVARAGLYARADWEQDIQKMPAPASAGADGRLAPRALVIGVAAGDGAKAFPVSALAAGGVVLDEVGGTPVAIVRAPDGRSTRVFDRRVEGRVLEFVARTDPFRIADTASGSEWNFTGAAVTGPLTGRLLSRVPYLEEYWFDWKTYHPSTELATRLK
ncbi:MAG: hypothetical protein A3F69_03450 [Acidobacteria bacterium RIFCSPLOWO2_12_FULL_66_10]|nr:MAG: hypothetical protein A3F69_03450 [Acidobacteria bacterium RIFCSPLOWO2_12_FULL_66_10]